MRRLLPEHTRRRLDIQGLDGLDDEHLVNLVPWLRMAFALCATLAGAGTVLASPTILLVLAPIAAIAAASPVHPFDLIYNYGIRHVTGTGPLPRRGAPSRFGCGMGAVMLVITAWAFADGHLVLGYALGGTATIAAVLVGTVDICIPSMMYRAMFGWPRARNERRAPTAPIVTARDA